MKKRDFLFLSDRGDIVLARCCYLLVLCWCVLGFTPAIGAAEDTAAEHGTHGTHAAHGDTHDLSHANAGPGQEDPAEFKSDLAIYTFVVFMLLLSILGKFAWGPISQGLEKRENAIAEEIASAQRSNQEAKDLLTDHEAKLAGAASEVRELLDQARRDAETNKQQILAEAQQAAKAEKDRALREITAAKNEALGELAQKSVDTAVTLAGRIVRRRLNAEDHAQLIRESLQQFPHENN